MLLRNEGSHGRENRHSRSWLVVPTSWCIETPSVLFWKPTWFFVHRTGFFWSPPFVFVHRARNVWNRSWFFGKTTWSRDPPSDLFATRTDSLR